MTSTPTTVPADLYGWTNPLGGTWAAAANWIDTTTNSAAVTVPGSTNSVTITGGMNGVFTDITGAGSAAQLAISNNVVLWGSVAVTGAVTVGAASNLALDGGATLSGGSISINGGTVQIGNSSFLSGSGGAILANGLLVATGGGAIQLGSLIAGGIINQFSPANSTIAVDNNSAIEVGTAGGAASGAVTIDNGNTAAVSGTLDGNLVLNGSLGVQAGGFLSIDVTDPFGTARTISGSGTLVLSQQSRLTLGIADSATIQFAGPRATLVLDALPSGTIRGFAAGDVIDLVGLATGVSYTQNTANLATLTLTKGGQAAGMLTLAGNYAGSLFHLGVNAAGDGFISLQTIGSAPAQPTLIVGTAGQDTLIATANNQTLTGLGLDDALQGGGFTGIDFRDTSANLNGSTITGFSPSDVIDLTDVQLSSAAVAYVAGAGQPTFPYTVTPQLIVADSTHSATIGIAFSGALPVGYLATSADGGGGTAVSYLAVNTDAYSFASAFGGNYGIASSWQDTTTSSTATSPASYGNAVSIAGGGTYTSITGSGFAGSLTTIGDVLLWGTINIGSKVAGVSGALTQAGTLALDGAAMLTLSGPASLSGTVRLGGASKLIDAGTLAFTSNGASLLAVGGSSVRSSNVSAGGGNPGSYDASVISVDATSSIELGTTGNAPPGALTIDSGVTANLGGTIDGNIVVHGTLAVATGALTINPFGTAALSISGSGGVLEITNGGTLTLNGPDSEPVLFAPAQLGTLALATNLPTALITGFVTGDMITVAHAATGLSYTQNSNTTGTLSLLNGGSRLGTLTFSGIYAASRFLLTLNGPSVSITYMPAPGTVPGNQISNSSDAYAWTNGSGGVWSNAANWNDITAPTIITAAPGAGNPVTIGNSLGTATTQIISGPGSAAALTVTASTAFTGALSIAGLLNTQNASGVVALETGAVMNVGSLSGTLLVAGGSALTVSGASGGTSLTGLGVVSSSSVKSVGGSYTDLEGMISVDLSSTFEIGANGGAPTGAVTIDVGQSPVLIGTIAAKLLVNGVLDLSSGRDVIQGFGGTVGSVTGSGALNFEFGGTLVLNAADSAAIAFSNLYPATLELQGPLPTGTMTGFVGSGFAASGNDVIQLDRTITGATFVQTNGTIGTLTLTNGAATVGTLLFSGVFAGNLFHVDVDPASGFARITLQTASSGSGSATASVATDAYGWTGASAGSWSTAANWLNTTTSLTPITVPGSGDPVTIAGGTSPDQYTNVSGNGSAASLTISNNVMLTGQVTSAGSVGVVSTNAPGALALDSGARLVGGTAMIAGRMQVGGASSATISGTATLTGGSLLALGGSTVQVGSLIGNGNNNVIAIDTNSVFKIGVPASALAGALTEAASATAALSGSIYGSVAVGGTFAVVGGGALFIDMNGTAAADPYAIAPTIGGSGVLSLSEGSTLGLGVADSAAIAFSGPGATLALAKLPTATISGFAAGDQIQIDQSVTGLSYQQISVATAALTLTRGTSIIGTLTLAGSYGNGAAFHLDPAPNGGTAVITLQSLGGAPTQPTLIRGTAGADLLTATGNGQTITGVGGADTLSGASFTGIDFADLTANLSGCTIQDFVTSDVLDFADMHSGTTTARYASGVLSVTDGAHTASLTLGFLHPPTIGAPVISSDGANGTKLVWS